MKQLERNICIVGAGPSGLSTALFLAKKGIASTIIDKHSFPRDKICGDAFSGKVAWVLRKLDEQIELKIASESFQLPSWGVKFYGTKNNELKVPFKLDYNSAEENAPGFIAPRLDFDNYLYNLAKNNPLIEIIENISLQKFERIQNKVFAYSTKEDFKISADIMIAADGAYSKVAKDLLGFSVADENNSLGLRAYYKNVSGLDSEGFIELHFLKELLPGYFWIFPMTNGMANVGAGIRPDLMRKQKINLKEVFKKIVAEHPIISHRFKQAELVDNLKLYGLPLGGIRRPISGERIILTGDAAALIDPFTGEGIGNAMISGMLAAEQIEKCFSENNFTASFINQYDDAIYRRMLHELSLSKKMQELTRYPWLFDYVVNKAIKNKELRETISCMFENVDIRAKLQNPLFYFRILFN